MHTYLVLRHGDMILREHGQVYVMAHWVVRCLRRYTNIA